METKIISSFGHGGADVGREGELDGDVAFKRLEAGRDVETHRRPQYVQRGTLSDHLLVKSEVKFSNSLRGNDDPCWPRGSYEFGMFVCSGPY